MGRILLYTLFALLSLSAYAAEKSGLKVIDCTALHKGDLIELNILFECDGIAISPNEQLTVHPVLIGKSDTLRLPPLLFTGNVRNKVNHRLARFNGEATSEFPDYNMKQLIKSGHTQIAYSRRIPFHSWMYGSRLVLESTVTGCADCQRDLEDISLAYIPKKLNVSYIIPKAEQKVLHKNVSLYLNFHQAKWDILPDFMNNHLELVKADSLISELANDPYITVDSISIVGYASPEGKYDYNTRLSGNRAQALKEFLEKRYTPKRYILNTVAASEDWDGLRRSITKENPPYRDQLLTIIDSTSNPDVRDSYIRGLDNGAVYASLLHNIYPSLRRVVCDAGYTVKPFTREQAEERLATHPEQVSLNEMYIIAQSYPAGSPKFNELFGEMLTLYPDNIAARNNLAAVAIEMGDVGRARSCLEKISHSPEVQNNLGVLLYREGKINDAKHCFEKACACGCKEAVANLQEINTLMAIQ